MIDLNEMAIFAKVVEAGTFTAAATALGLPKSTVSRRVSQLEARLGTRLLQRTTRSVRLTELGAAYYERCARIVAEADEAERVVSREQERPRGLLRVSAPVELGAEVLGALAADYLQRYPEVDLELDLSNRFVDLVEEGYDLAIRAGQLEDSSLVARRLGASRMLVCASPGYLAARGEPVSPGELKHHDCILYGQLRRRASFEFSGPTGIASVQLEGRLVVNNLAVAQDAAKAGLGIAMLPDSQCRQALEQGLLKQLLADWSLPQGGIYAVYPSPRHLTPKVRSFIDFLSERLTLSV